MSPDPLTVCALNTHMMSCNLIKKLEAATPSHLSTSENPEFFRMDSKVTPITDGKISY